MDFLVPKKKIGWLKRIEKEKKSRNIFTADQSAAAGIRGSSDGAEHCEPRFFWLGCTSSISIGANEVKMKEML